MFRKNKIKRQELNIFVAALAIFFAANLNPAVLWAQNLNEEDAKARDFSIDLSTQLAKSKEENYNKLKDELEKVRKYNEQLETKSKELYLKSEREKEQARDRKSLEAALRSYKNESKILKEQKDELIKKIDDILKSARLREANIYGEQAMACMKAKFFELAINAYENAIKLDPDNAKFHYNLSLLYNHVYEDKKRAAQHMKEYLRLTPHPKDREEAQYIADMLSQDLYTE